MKRLIAFLMPWPFRRNFCSWARHPFRAKPKRNDGHEVCSNCDTLLAMW